MKLLAAVALVQWLAVAAAAAVTATPTHVTSLFYSTEITAFSGGFADRMLGVMNAYVLAKQTNRTFGIEWKRPAQLDRVLPPRLGARWNTPIVSAPNQVEDVVC